MKHVILLSLTLLVAGCATGLPIKKYNDLPAAPEAFSICHGYSCTHKSKAGFTSSEWQSVLNILRQNPAKTPEEERSKIGHAIAQMEEYTGKKTGTDEDHAEAVGFKTSIYQLDCIDETVNTTQYVTLLQQAGALKFHEITEPTHRGYLIDGTWPHNTAVIKEKASGALFVVDSFYRANGQEPYIMPRQTWLDGWKPAGSKQ